MRNLLVTIQYIGTAYHGWQVQDNAVSVQQTVQDAVECVTGVRSGVIGCSRTDAGVHANEYCFNFRTESSVATEKIPAALNAYLPEDVAAFACREVSYDFHARYDCKEKEYIYLIYNAPARNPFYRDRALHYRTRLDETLLDLQARQFEGKHCFSSFCAADSSVEDTVRTIFAAGVERDGDMVIFRVRGNGFLYNMVRIMAGTLLDISRGRISQNSIPDIIRSENRLNAGVTAPAHGLYLNRVIYSCDGV